MNQRPTPTQFDRGAPIETLAGTIERVTFHNAETGFCVLKVQARGKRDLAPVIGHAPAIAAGEWITATGIWFTDRQHGLQFKADTLKATPPTGVEGIERYLASGYMRGIGPAMAKRIVALFGEATFEIIEADPERLKEVSGIGPTRAARIVSGWAEQKAVREIMIFLHAHGVGTARAVRIFKTYCYESIVVMTEDPYRLARDIRGIGFRTADAIAMRLGLTKEAPQRLRADVSFALQTAIDEGHCGLPIERLIVLAQKLLEVDVTLVRTAVADELARGEEVIADTVEAEACVFLTGLHAAERAIAERLVTRALGSPPWPSIDLDKARPWVEAKTGKTLSPSQGEAIRLMLASKLCVITGGPGVGKTSTLDSLLRILTAKGVKVLLAAPTGRAAKRMTEQTRLEAKTIHRLLEIDPKRGGFSRNEENPLDCDLLVLDECSMIDVPLMNALLKAVPERSGLLLVGDVDQLPSVGPGQVLADVIASGRVPMARLTEVFRQAAESRIIVNAHRINQGQMPERPRPGEKADFYLIEIDDPDVGVAKLIEVVTKRIPRSFGLDPIRDVQVLTPMLRGSLGSRNLNHELQSVLNPNPAQQIERFGWRFTPGDRVMETQNDYDRDVFNGDLGMVVSATPTIAARCPTASRQSPRRVVSAATSESTACSARVNCAARPGGSRPAATAGHRGLCAAKSRRGSWGLLWDAQTSRRDARSTAAPLSARTAPRPRPQTGAPLRTPSTMRTRQPATRSAEPPPPAGGSRRRSSPLTALLRPRQSRRRSGSCPRQKAKRHRLGKRSRLTPGGSYDVWGVGDWSRDLIDFDGLTLAGVGPLAFWA